ncbi:MAG: ribulose-phosphate 3-epimerase [Rickettsiales bacterium]|jgi:ribulose-phosphate 3-epimerase|nr:ribulose-phosphate 3-epimerase [Rickettsiales bacterium]
MSDAIVIYFGRNRVKAAASFNDKIIIKTKDISANPGDALNAVLDELEAETRSRFKRAFIAGYFGGQTSGIVSNSLAFPYPKKITESDVRKMIAALPELQNPELSTIHLVPIRWDADGQNVDSPVGIRTADLRGDFFAILCPRQETECLARTAEASYLEPVGFIDMMQVMYKFSGEALLIHLGGSATRIAVGNDAGIVHMDELGIGQMDLTKQIADRFDISFLDAEKLKIQAAVSPLKLEDQFDTIGSVNAADIKDEISGFFKILAGKISDELAAKFPGEIPKKIILFGGGSNVKVASKIISETLDGTAIAAAADTAIAAACRSTSQQPSRSRIVMFLRRIIYRLASPKCPIQPSSLSFGRMTRSLLRQFEEAGVREIHYDFMDGKWTPQKTGSAKDAANITRDSALKFSAHLMAGDPAPEIPKFIRAGADSIVLITGSRNLAQNLAHIKQAGVKCGIALNPEDEIDTIAPIIKHLDRIIVMSVVPGIGGQQFMIEVLDKVRRLCKVRAKGRLKFQIIMDGGINEETAQLCWRAGADELVSGSYLFNASNLRPAINSLLPKCQKT